jgi:hypothetical protein
MRLDHVSYVTSHEQLADNVQRIGSLLGTSFVDGGIHPRFGTRNFTAPLMNNTYIEVVCPLDHPATEQTPWGMAVSKKAREGGGWLTWVFSTENLKPIEIKFGRQAIEAHRTRPDGSDLKWKQIGVKEIAESREFPFFIQWMTSDHPSRQGESQSKIQVINIADSNKLESSWFKKEIFNALGEVTINWLDPSHNYGETGIVSIQVSTPNGVFILD